METSDLKVILEANGAAACGGIIMTLRYIHEVEEVARCTGMLQQVGSESGSIWTEPGRDFPLRAALLISLHPQR